MYGVDPLSQFLICKCSFQLLICLYRILFQDEVVCVSEKAVLRVVDLLDWIADPKDIQWYRGTLGVCHSDCLSSPAEHKSSLNCNSDDSKDQGDGGAPCRAVIEENGDASDGDHGKEPLPEDPSKRPNSTPKGRPEDRVEAAAEDDASFMVGGAVGGIANVLNLPGGIRAKLDGAAAGAKHLRGHSEFLADVNREKFVIGKILKAKKKFVMHEKTCA